MGTKAEITGSLELLRAIDEEAITPLAKAIVITPIIYLGGKAILNYAANQVRASPDTLVWINQASTFVCTIVAGGYLVVNFHEGCRLAKQSATFLRSLPWNCLEGFVNGAATVVVAAVGANYLSGGDLTAQMLGAGLGSNLALAQILVGYCQDAKKIQ